MSDLACVTKRSVAVVSATDSLRFSASSCSPRRSRASSRVWRAATMLPGPSTRVAELADPFVKGGHQRPIRSRPMLDGLAQSCRAKTRSGDARSASSLLSAASSQHAAQRGELDLRPSATGQRHDVRNGMHRAATRVQSAMPEASNRCDYLRQLPKRSVFLRTILWRSPTTVASSWRLRRGCRSIASTGRSSRDRPATLRWSSGGQAAMYATVGPGGLAAGSDRQSRSGSPQR